MRFDHRGVAIALAITFAGALAATAAEAVWTTAQAMMLLHGKFGLPVSMVLDTVSRFYVAALEFFIVAAALLWPLASWRLALPLFAAGLLLLVGAAFLALGHSDLDRAQLTAGILILGVVANFFLRIVNWAHGKWSAGPTEELKT